MKRIKYLLVGLLLMGGVFISHSSLAFATDPIPLTETQSQVCQGIGLGSGGTGDCNADSGTSVNSVIHTVISILSYITGIAAIIMIILSSFKYITSGGDSNKIGNAKTTLVFALIGLAIAVLAQVLVLFVFRQVATGSTTTTTGSTTTTTGTTPGNGSKVCSSKTCN